MKKFLAIAVLVVVAMSAFAQSTGSPHLTLGVNAPLNGWVPMGADSSWNQRIDNAAVDPNSAAILKQIGGNVMVDREIPYVVVDSRVSTEITDASKTPFVNVTIKAEPKSNGEFYPQLSSGTIGNVTEAPIPSGQWFQSNSDGHGIVIDMATMESYEFWWPTVTLNPAGGQTWSAAMMARWNLLAGDNQRPWFTPAATGAGVSYFPGLLKFDEAQSPNGIKHALAFCLAPANVGGWFTPPALMQLTHNAATLPGMGAKFRLRSSFDVSKYSPTNQNILKALKQYGMVLVDLGSNLYVTATSDTRWDATDLRLLKQVKASDFEVVNAVTRYDYHHKPTN